MKFVIWLLISNIIIIFLYRYYQKNKEKINLGIEMDLGVYGCIVNGFLANVFGILSTKGISNMLCIVLFAFYICTTIFLFKKKNI